MNIGLILLIVTILLMAIWAITRRAARAKLGKAVIQPNVKEFWIPLVFSVILLGASLYVILSGGYDEGTRKWAFGLVGTILGFWMKTAA
jgi:hypothetical protein